MRFGAKRILLFNFFELIFGGVMQLNNLGLNYFLLLIYPNQLLSKFMAFSYLSFYPETIF